MADFFDAWVYDSYAGFIGEFHGDDPGGRAGGRAKQAFNNGLHLVAEGQRYVRWREVYAGDQRLNIAQVSGGDDGRRTA